MLEGVGWISVAFRKMNEMIQGKIVALFGLGDQVNYSEWYLDAWAYFDRVREIGTRL